ncbi:MAG: hypothetical protein AAFR59_11085 [Bacteroidota bacterium]
MNHLVSTYSYCALFFLLVITGCQTSHSSPKTNSEQRAIVSTNDSLASHTAEDRAILAHRQILLVTTDNWDTPKGTLSLHTWDEAQQSWKQEGEALPVLIGKKGLGWGLGMHDAREWEGPRKKEGDLKSPAGVFELGTAFGYQVEAPAFDWPYMSVVNTTMCIEDVQSHYYNQILEEGETTPDWSSTDHMLRKDDLYEWGIFVSHNTGSPTPGGGSCIFIHVWREGGNGTAGCTSLDKSELKKMLHWMDPKAQTLLVQAPKPVLSQLTSQFDYMETLVQM